MTADEVKASLAKAARRAWPNAAKASDLPFPAYWKGVTEYLVFHSPRIGDKLMLELVDYAVSEAVTAETLGVEPKEWRVPDEIRKFWEGTERGLEHGRREGRVARGLRGVEAANQDAEAANQDAWEHAAERAAAARDFFARRARRRKTA